MPVEIRELIIRAYVESENKTDVKSCKDSYANDESNYSSSDEIAQLLEVINNKNER
jgi:hypothetical protein